MDRSEVIAKIQAMLRLQQGTSFEGEAANAARLIDKLCREHGITLSEATTPQVSHELFSEFKKLNSAIFRILSAVARFYDAQAYIYRGKQFKIIGTEAQQIVVKVYFDYIVECMEKEAEKAYLAEKVLANLMGNEMPARNFKHHFRLAFADTVKQRLQQLKIDEGREHEHKEYTLAVVNTIRWRNVSISAGSGEGANAGQSAGASVSLRRQASGSQTRALSAG